MKRTMVYLPDELHKNLRRLAVERESSLAALVREALESLYQEDIEDLAYSRKFLSRYKVGGGMDYEAYRALRLRKA